MARDKRLERERRLAERRRHLWGRISLAALAAAAVITLTVLVYRSSIFTVRAVEVVGNQHLTAEHVRDVAAVAPGVTLLRLDAGAIEERLMSDPWVLDAAVSRDFPDTVRIRVEEREAAALIDLGDTFWVVDAAGYVIEEQSLEETSSLIVVRGVEGVEPKVGRVTSSDTLDNALTILSGISPELRGIVRAVVAEKVDETRLVTAQGVEIMIGEAVELDTKDYIVRTILEDQAGKVVFIDVRSTDDAVVRGL